MVRGFPATGTRVQVVSRVGGVRAGTIAVVKDYLETTERETPEDVFVLALEPNDQEMWAFRRNLESAG